MSRFSKKVLLVVLCLEFLVFLYPVYLRTHQAEIAKQSQLASLLDGEEEIAQINLPTQFSDCEAQEPLPDKDCTPGSIFEDVTREDICVSGYSKTARNVSQNTKKKVFLMYRVDYPVPFGSYEIDHLIPLALGGSNRTSNLWPKSAEYPGFYEKNITGNFLHEEVCAGRIALSIAQERIANDWFLIYDNLSEEKIKELKSRYKNWADRPINK